LSAEKTLDILDLFSLETRQLTVSQIAEMLNQPTSSVYRHLRILKEKGFIVESNAGEYKLGYRFLEMAKIVRSQNSISSIALPIMRHLSIETEETSILTIVSGLNAVSLETVNTLQPIKVTAEHGKILPLYGGASSKALLAYMPEKTVEQLFKLQMVKRHTDNTIIELGQMKANLNEIRTIGYAKSDSELDEGVYAYGVPIRDTDDNVVASLSIAGPRDRMLEKDEAVLVKHLQAAVQEIQKQL
jgi:DNA-binding IclR family transcriptional regulator